MATNYYELLRVPRDADAAAIEAAWQVALEQYAPERLAGMADELRVLAAERRDALAAAYAVLGDPAARRRYDATLAAAARTAEPAYDYRPLPPAGRCERARGFADQPLAAPVASSATRASLPLVGAIIAICILLPALLFSAVITNVSSLQPPAATATPSALDQLETLITQARAATQQEPDNAQIWVDYANLLYDSVQVVREQQPDSVLYQQRLPRWLEAIAAYRRALELAPGEERIRAEIGASACYYGDGAADRRYVEEGLAELQRATAALPDDPRAWLNLGFCYTASQPPQRDAAIAAWQRVIAIGPPDSVYAIEAQRLIDAQGDS